MLVFFVFVISGISSAQYSIPMRHHKYFPPRFLQAHDHYRYYSLLPEEDRINNYHCVKLCFAFLPPQYASRNIYQCYSNYDCPENHICSFSENLQHGTCVLLRRYLHDFEGEGVAPSKLGPSFVPRGQTHPHPSEFRDVIRCSGDVDCPPNTKCVAPGICAFIASSVLSEDVGSGDYRSKRDELDSNTDDDDLIFDGGNDVTAEKVFGLYGCTTYDQCNPVLIEIKNTTGFCTVPSRRGWIFIECSAIVHKGLCPSPGNSTRVYPRSYTEYLLCVTDLDCSNDRKCCDYSAYEHKVCLKAVEET